MAERERERKRRRRSEWGKGQEAFECDAEPMKTMRLKHLERSCVNAILQGFSGRRMIL